jgi:hypothetical protein
LGACGGSGGGVIVWLLLIIMLLLKFLIEIKPKRKERNKGKINNHSCNEKSLIQDLEVPTEVKTKSTAIFNL